ncbi:MAG: winged helix-turn-helix domain-containing protein [Micromonosporaceae bacterium]
MDDSVSLAQARRIALAAQGFADPRPTGAPNLRHLRRVLGRTALLQMDSVNVLQRAHYLPLFSRLGSYAVGLLDRAAYRRPRELFEYWGHEASLLPVALHPLLRWRMARAEDDAWGWMRRVARERPDLLEWIRVELREKGPLTAAQLEQDARGPKLNWGWNWSLTKQALEFLFYHGEVAAAERDSAWARRYDLAERVLPPAVIAAPTPAEPDALRELVRISAASLGVAAEVELRDYFRLPVAGTRQAIAELVEAGELRPVTVEGWRQRAYLHRDARVPRRIRAATLVSPFDPLIWERGRTERLFGFRYRIEIYVPAEQRVHGYYVLPFLLGDRLVARVDLKADRKAAVLQIPGAWAEPGHPVGEVALALAEALGELAEWLGLAEVAAPVRGDLAGPLTAALGSRPRSTVVA